MPRDALDAPLEPKSPDGKKRKRRRARLVPAGLRREDVAFFVGVSIAAWDRLCASGQAPRAVRLGSRLIWRRKEILQWLDEGSPCLEAWEAIKATKKATGRRRCG